MAAWAGGKGSNARAVDTDKFNANWDLIWGKKEKMMMNKAEMVHMLTNNVAIITFTKLNGDVRVLRGTLIESLLPVKEVAPDEVEIETITEAQERKGTNENVVVVFDVEIDSYRSFRVDSVTSMEIVY